MVSSFLACLSVSSFSFKVFSFIIIVLSLINSSEAFWKAMAYKRQEGANVQQVNSATVDTHRMHNQPASAGYLSPQNYSNWPQPSYVMQRFFSHRNNPDQCKILSPSLSNDTLLQVQKESKNKIGLLIFS